MRENTNTVKTVREIASYPVQHLRGQPVLDQEIGHRARIVEVLVQWKPIGDVPLLVTGRLRPHRQQSNSVKHPWCSPSFERCCVHMRKE